MAATGLALIGGLTLTAGDLIAAGSLASKALPSAGRVARKSIDEGHVKGVWEKAIAYDKIKRGVLVDARKRVAEDIVKFIKDRSEVFDSAEFQRRQALTAEVKVEEAMAALKGGNAAGKANEKSGLATAVADAIPLVEKARTLLVDARRAADDAAAGDRTAISAGPSRALTLLAEATGVLKRDPNSRRGVAALREAQKILGDAGPLEDRLLAEPDSPDAWLGRLVALKAWFEFDVRGNKDWRAVLKNWGANEKDLRPQDFAAWANAVARRFLAVAENDAKMSNYLSRFFLSRESELSWFERLHTARRTVAATRLADSMRIMAIATLAAALAGATLVGMDAFEIADTSELWSNIFEKDNECVFELFRQDDCPDPKVGP